MYGSDHNPSTPANVAILNGASEIAPLELIVVDRDHHWLHPTGLGAEAFEDAEAGALVTFHRVVGR